MFDPGGEKLCWKGPTGHHRDY